MRLEFDLAEYLRRALPYHKRQTNRIALFGWSLGQIALSWSQFRDWRKEMIYESNITGQRLSLIDLLNRRVTNANSGITIIEYNDGGIWLSTLDENSDVAEMSLISEDEDYEEIAMKGEALTQIAGYFKVLVPSAINFEEVKKIVDRYIIAGFDYEVTDTL